MRVNKKVVSLLQNYLEKETYIINNIETKVPVNYFAGMKVQPAVPGPVATPRLKALNMQIENEGAVSLASASIFGKERNSSQSPRTFLLARCTRVCV